MRNKEISVKKKIFSGLLVVAACLVALGVATFFSKKFGGQGAGASSSTSYIMGTVVSVTAYGDTTGTACEDVFHIISSLEDDVISWRIEGSQVADVNANYQAGVPYEISADLASYILVAKEASDKGNGLLDITIRTLADVWAIEDGATSVPEESAIKNALADVDYTAISVVDEAGKEMESVAEVTAEGTYFLVINRDGLTIDLGALGKGIACDVALEFLEKSDVTGATVSVGGSILCYGEKSSGSTFKIGVRNPRSEADTAVMGVVDVDAKETSYVISTSGDYEKYFEEDGVRYHHILNPVTGYPANTGTISATVICENGALSDALSTLCVLLEREEALALADTFDAVIILIDEDKNVYISGENDNISFSITNEEYSLND